MSGRGIFAAIVSGIAIAALWSFHFVDTVIGGSIIDGMLGPGARTEPILGLTAGMAFAFAAGVAGTVTACNVCVLAAMAPIAGQADRLSMFRPLGWLIFGALFVSALYGAVGVIIAPALPQMSDGKAFDLLPMRLAQASVVYVILGVIMLAWGLAKAGVILRRAKPLADRWDMAPHLLMGMLIGAFLIGRPFPLFRKMFAYAVEVASPLYGALTFALQSFGNVLLIVLIMLALSLWKAPVRWLAANPARANAITAFGFITGGSFFLAYWGLRVPSRYGIGWFPAVAW